MKKSDTEIARETRMEPIEAVAERAGIPGDALLRYGLYKGKVNPDWLA